MLAGDGPPIGACDPPQEIMIPTRYLNQLPVHLVSMFVLSAEKAGWTRFGRRFSCNAGASATLRNGPACVSHELETALRLMLTDGETSKIAHWMHTSGLEWRRTDHSALA